MKEVEIYTDGACSGNPGPGGWAAILKYRKKETEIYGFEKDTTNNRMEITAAIKGLKALKYPCNVNLYTDSAYLADAFNKKWIEKWEMLGWKKADKKELLNIDLWKKIFKLSKIHNIKWVKVKGHSDNEYNNRCDKLAVNAIKEQLKEK